MRSKLNRMMAQKQPTRGLQPPPRQSRELRVLDNTKPLQRAPESRKWLLVLVEPRCEQKAAEVLREAGHLAWYPQMTMWQTNARLRIKAKVNRPLFPRYLFVAKGECASKSIKDSDHVTHLVGELEEGKLQEGKKTRAVRLMEELSGRQEYGDFDTTKVQPPLSPFDHAMLAEGPFADLAGLVLKSDIERTTILFKIFGSDREIVVDTDCLRKVA